jgi:phosphoribosylanthranilate isomerase
MFPDQKLTGVKICGITQEQQAREIISLGADALGINFWPKSKRYLPIEAATNWLPSLLDQTTLIAVLVNPEAETLDTIIDQHLVHILQLHGDETPSEVAALQDRGCLVIKALQVRDRESLLQIGSYSCETILLDAYNPGLYGGSGETFPWDLAVIAQDMYPEKRIILSGGLTPANVRQAIEATHPAAVDVASGVESSPGIKDLVLVREFIEQCRGAT